MVTIFVAQTSQSLRVDYGQVTASLLIELIEVQRSTANSSVVTNNNIPRSDLTFRPSTFNAWVNGLWFTSLSLSLATALFVVLTKQWIHQYTSVSSGTPRDRCRLRQFRYMGLQKWGVDLIIGFLPIPMSVSLAVFMVGLVLFIIPLQISTASVVGAITFASFAAYLITSFLSVLYPSCPYKTPLSQYMFFLYTNIMDSAAFFNFKDYSPTASTIPASSALKHAEIAAVERYADEMDVYALSWLYSMSSNPSVQSIVVQSTSALPLKSVESLSYQIPDLPGLCHSALSDLLSEPYENHQGQIDRFTRASLRFPESSFSVGVDDSMQGRLSQEVYAQLLCFHDTGREKIRKLFLSNSSAEGIALQPIVWARLLCRLLPFGPDDRDVTQYLLQAIPSSYWQAEFVCPPLVFEQQGMSIFNNTGSEAVSLQAAVNNHLYPWVGENIIRGSLNITDSIFNPDEYPSSQDLRLQFLLTLAGSPSIMRTFREHIPPDYLKDRDILQDRLFV